MRASLIPNCVMLFDERQSATARAQHHANLLLLFGREFLYWNSRILKSFACGGQCQRYSARDVLSIFGIELRLPIKVAHLRGDLYGRLGYVKRFNPAHATLAVLQTGPESLSPNSDRRDTPHAGNDYPARTLEIIQHATLASCRRRASIPLGYAREPTWKSGGSFQRPRAIVNTNSLGPTSRRRNGTRYI